jgi:hypothetical protein
MKRRLGTCIIVLMCLTGLAACSGKDGNNMQNQSANDSTTASQVITATTVPETTKAPYGVTKLSLYIYNKGTGLREKSGGYQSTWVQGKDIVSFEAYATTEDTFSLAGTNFQKKWQSYWNAFDNYENCKIGYVVSFKLKSGEEIKKTITGPNDVFGYRNYLECYLYDDVNQIQGNWYSHLLDTQVTDATVMTSIKFTAGTDIAQVGDTITLTAFVYSTKNKDDFDASGNYIGQTSYTVTVKNQG